MIKNKINKIDLVLLAGGRGSRISAYTKNKPKPLLKFAKKEFISYLIDYYSKFPFKKIFILAGYKGKQIYNFYNNKLSNGIKIECIVEKKILGTGGALSQLQKKTRNSLIIMNADSFIRTDLSNFFKNSNVYKSNYIFLTRNKNYKSNKNLSNLNLQKNSLINFKGNLMNAGIYYFKNNIIKGIPKKNISLENNIIYKLIEKKLIKGKKINSNFIDIGTYKNYEIGQKNFYKEFFSPAAFLDRDGVINYDYGYVSKMKHFRLRKNVIKGLKLLNKKNYNIFIVTNQSGIARGYFTEENFLNFYKSIKEYFFKRGCFINDLQYCPFLKGAKIKKYNKSSKLRKPDNLMIKNLMNKWIIDKKKSFMIGDSEKDKIAAEKSDLYFEFAKKNFFIQIKNILLKN